MSGIEKKMQVNQPNTYLKPCLKKVRRLSRKDENLRYDIHLKICIIFYHYSIDVEHVNANSRVESI